MAEITREQADEIWQAIEVLADTHKPEATAFLKHLTPELRADLPRVLSRAEVAIGLLRG